MRMLRVISWNVRRATVASKCWRYLEELDADLVLLQEVGGIPHSLRDPIRSLRQRLRLGQGPNSTSPTRS